MLANDNDKKKRIRRTRERGWEQKRAGDEREGDVNGGGEGEIRDKEKSMKE